MARIREGKFASLQTKLLWTALFFALFLIGRNIPIPLLHGELAGSGLQLLAAANVATGGDFFSPSLFSLGLGPWMAAAILWRFLFIGKFVRGRKIPQTTEDRARNVFVVILAVIQAIAMVSRYEVSPIGWPGDAGRALAESIVVLLLTAGALVVAWLAHRNEELGLGGITMFILYQLVFTFVGNLDSLPAAVAEAGESGILWVIVLACAGAIGFAILSGVREVRLHVNKVSIDSGYIGVSYLPIKFNPAGPSPIMYSLALLVIPQSVARALGAVLPGAETGADRFLDVWSLAHPVGFIAYLLLLFGLTLFFGLLTIDPRETAKRMRDRGEYFDGIPPGAATLRHLRSRVLRLSAISGALLVLLTGLPLAFLGAHPALQYLLMLPGTLMIVIGLLWRLREEIADTLIGKRYDFAFDTRVREVRA
ncbi:hypothetical protein [Leucobacter massiliensis]|uniref:Accessory Sec system protein translocase subunit SecY2 n=1 Tax=Leucobacter massiliensis TaxID=1686285 RepID=A0A2S9QR65_9MICO|nr:hypothetical protein [Leucobacter massiliensis]PRI12084.1 hypothetical protein B4915_03220 [Leucobacter massiliensis]